MSLCIADARTDEAWGYTGLVVRDRVAEWAEIGYWMVPAARGLDLETTAVRLLAPWAFAAFGLVRLELRIERDNVGSRRVAERAGFVWERVLRGGLECGGERRDVIVYARRE